MAFCIVDILKMDLKRGDQQNSSVGLAQCKVRAHKEVVLLSSRNASSVSSQFTTGMKCSVDIIQRFDICPMIDTCVTA